MENRFIEKFRRESIILGNRNANYLNPVVVIGNSDNLKSHLLRIKGNSDGKFFDGNYKEIPATLTTLREKEKEMMERWQQHRTDQLKLGNQRPQNMPLEMQEEKLKLEARIMVVNEEILWLEEKLQEALEQQAKAKPSLLTHQSNWGSGQLGDGVLVSIGPWKVGMDPEKQVLCIMDASSRFNGLEVHRFKALIVNPMGMEFAHRHKQEEKSAVAEGRPKKAVKYPEPPSWNSETDVIEYHDIDNSIIIKLKKEN